MKLRNAVPITLRAAALAASGGGDPPGAPFPRPVTLRDLSLILDWVSLPEEPAAPAAASDRRPISGGGIGPTATEGKVSDPRRFIATRALATSATRSETLPPDPSWESFSPCKWGT